jgi:hypothetical protein
VEGYVASCHWLAEEMVRSLVPTFVMGVAGDMNEMKTSASWPVVGALPKVALTSSIDDRAENTIARA